MTAPALTIANPTPAGPAGPGASKAAAGGAAGNAAQGAAAAGPLTGFESLLTALFPQAGPTPAAGPQTAVAGATQRPAKGKDGKADAAADAATGAATLVVDAAPADPAAALLAGLITAPAAAPQTAAKAAPGGDLEAMRPKGMVRPLFPLNLGADAKPGAPGTGEPAPEAAPETADPAPLGAPLRLATAETPAPARAGPLQTALAGAMPPPSAVAAQAATKPQAKAEAAPSETPALASGPQATAAAATVDAPTQAMAASLLARPDPAPAPGPTPGAKPVKGERGKSIAEASVSDLRAPEAVDKPVTAHAASAAAKPAAAEAETAEAKGSSAKAAPESPDGAPAAEARAGVQTTAPSAHALHAARGTPETVATLAAEMVRKLEAKSTRFDLQLDPAGLGKVDVRIEIGATGRMTAAMTFDNPQAAADLKARAAELHRALEQAGFDLTGGLSFDVAGDGGRQGQGWRDQADTNSGRAFRGQAFQAALDTAGDAADAALGGALRLRRGLTAGLDVRI
ncbi:flagellar hook-length control protein FliK [Phenylobacterium sp.]|uniref:flagellar hook-length control protein FliK n=1 Tax=Phenylobacterium sp. TaxID=1871053 RepID=UPI0025F9480F|nr:flagellar hook-length control protein FliK [Phenylobacterium sp.]